MSCSLGWIAHVLEAFVTSTENNIIITYTYVKYYAIHRVEWVRLKVIRKFYKTNIFNVDHTLVSPK